MGVPDYQAYPFLAQNDTESEGFLLNVGMLSAVKCHQGHQVGPQVAPGTR